LCLKPKLAYARNDPLDLFLSGVWLRNDDHVFGGGIIRMPWSEIFCKPRYETAKNHVLILIGWVFMRNVNDRGVLYGRLSLQQGEGEGEGLVRRSARGTLVLSPLCKGRGEKAARVPRTCERFSN
jgi:hypothetical protein